LVQLLQVVLIQLNTHWIAFTKFGEIVSTTVAMRFDEVNLDQEWRSFGDWFSPRCVSEREWVCDSKPWACTLIHLKELQRSSKSNNNQMGLSEILIFLITSFAKYCNQLFLKINLLKNLFCEKSILRKINRLIFGFNLLNCGLLLCFIIVFVLKQ